MHRSARFSIFPVVLGVCIAGLFSAVTAFAQSGDNVSSPSEVRNKVEDSGKKTRRSRKSLTKEDRSLIDVFKSIAISASDSTVRVQSGNLQIAVGTIVDEAGYILTKASEMRGDLKCKLPNGDVKPARVFGIDTENDLALLKIDAEGLAAAPLKPVSEPLMRGMWLASPTDQIGSLTVGVVGVEERKIPPSRAFIGIQMMDQRDDGGVRITGLVDRSPAVRAKLREDDVIVKIDELAIKNRQGLVEAIGAYTPGTDVKLTVQRKDKELVIRLTLADAQRTSPMNNRSRTQNSMGSRLSSRGKDFPRAFQHDMALEAKHCGGPVVDLDGQIVGVNIARSGRVASLAIPVDVVISVIEKLKSGNFSPVKVYADRIANSKEELAKVESKFNANKKSVAEFEKGYDDSKAKIEELERMREDLEQRIKEVRDQKDKFAREKRNLKFENSKIERSMRMLKHKLEAVQAGKKR